MDKNYIYSGPPSGVTLPDGRETVLHPGQSATLPEDNAWVRTNLALGNLTEAPEPEKTARKRKEESTDAS